jgi:hypothetical protein
MNFSVPLNQVIRFKPYLDGVGICKNGSREQVLSCKYVIWEDGVESPKNIGWFLFNLLQALAAKDSAKGR